MTPWARRVASAAHAAFGGDVPDDVLHRAAVHLFDALACAAGAVDAAPVEVVRRTITGSSPPVATIFFSRTRATVSDAVLVNGTAVRFLDANDVFLGSGPGGHPSDNIPTAVNVAEVTGSSGRDLLAVIAVGYDLVARLRRAIYRATPRGPDWHEVSLSGVVVATMAGLLAGADIERLTNAISISAAKGYALKEIRRGQISMLKACGNALVARDGLTAADLAMHGMVGPAEVFEGESGLVRTFGGTPNPAMIEDLCAEPEWAIRDVSIKPYPAIGTSQAAIHAAVTLVEETGPLGAQEVESITIRLPDTAYTREYVHLAERRHPRTRESADHSIQFLVALALRQGGVGPSDFEQERWCDDDIGALMEKIVVVADEALVAHTTTAFPARIDVAVAGGEAITRTVTRTPGSPENPWDWADVAAKFERLDRTGRSSESIKEVASAALGLVHAADVAELIAAVA